MSFDIFFSVLSFIFFWKLLAVRVTFYVLKKTCTYDQAYAKKKKMSMVSFAQIFFCQILKSQEKKTC